MNSIQLYSADGCPDYQINNGKRKTPSIIINDDIILVEPENEELRQALKINEVKEENIFNTIIIGGGAAEI